MGYFIDVAVEVCLVQRVKSEQEPSSPDAEIVSVFNDIDDWFFVEVEVKENVMSEVTLVVPLIVDLLEQLFILPEGSSLPLAHFIDIKLQS